jgi:hypothetical protein
MEKGLEIYIMGKLSSGEVSIDEFAQELEERGHFIREKWWQCDKLPVPYLDNPATSAMASVAMLNAAISCDVGILFPTDTILGAAVEFGAAIASKKIIKPEKQIIVVNPFEIRQSVFYTDPAVIAVHGLEQVRRMEWY